MTLAKLCRPGVARVVPRARLFRVLDRTAERAVTWIWGPPGAGKTTLAASYVAARTLRGLWYHLDSGDADLASFFVHLATAAPRRRRPLPVFTPEYRLAVPDFTRRAFRELFDRLRAPFCVVLDNHGDGAPAGELDEVLAEGMAQVPPGGRVLVTSRVRPPAAFARLEAERALAVVDGDALRFTTTESRALLRRMCGRSATPMRLQWLQTRTEGWAAGLVLLADAEPGAADDSGPAPPVVFDYFAREVLRAMPADERETLLELAILDRPTPALAEAVTGKPAASRILAELHQRGYFTSRADQRGPGYRMHPLFRDFLLGEARTVLSPVRRQALQRAAAAALDREGEWDEAAARWKEAGDLAALGRMARAQAPALLAQGRHQTLVDWLAPLPESLVEQDPWLDYWCALAMQPRDPRAGRERLERAFASFSTLRDVAGACAAWCAAIQTLAHELDDLTLLDVWLERLSRLPPAHGCFPSPDVEHRVAHTAMLALTFRRPAHPSLRGWAERAQWLERSAIEPTQRIEGLCIGITHHLWCGAPERAVALAASVREISSSADISPLLRVLAKMLVARAAWLCAAPTEWRSDAAAGIALGASHGITLYESQLLHECAAVALSEGAVDEARRRLDACGRDPEQLPTDVRSVHFALRAWEALLAGEPTRALRAAERSSQLTVEAGMPIAIAIAALLRSQALRASGRPDEAVVALEGALATAEQTGSAFLRWSAELVRADGALADGDRPVVLAALRRALAIGREQGLVCFYGAQPASIARLCAVALDADIETAFVREWITRCGLVAPAGLLARDAWPWPLEIVTLGRFEIRRDGVPLPSGRKAQRKPLELLQALLASGARGVSEGRVADLLWPEADGDAARAAFGTALHRLRRLLGHESAVRRGHGRVSLDPAVCWVDAWETGACLDVANADAGPAGERCLDRAAALYAGPFLEDGEGTPWAAASARKLQRRLLAALQASARRRAAQGDTDGASRRLARAAEIERERESVTDR